MNDVYVMAQDPLMRLGVHRLVGDDQVRAWRSVENFSDLPGPSDQGAIVILVAPLASVIRKVCDRQRTLVMLSTRHSVLVRAALDAGAHAVVTTAASAAQMRVALRVVATGGLYLCDELSQRLRAEAKPLVTTGAGGEDPTTVTTSVDGDDHRDGQRWRSLAPRETETLELVASGLTRAEVARRLGLAETTINEYLVRIRAKLDAGNTAELTRKAIACGLVHPIRPRVWT